MIHFLPKYANGEPNEFEKLPLWCDDDDDDYGLPVDTPSTQLGRDQTPDSLRKFVPIHARNGESDLERALPRVEIERPLKPAKNPPDTSLYDIIPLLRFLKWVGHKLFRTVHPRSAKRRKRDDIEYVESNIPLEILLILSKYVPYKSFI